jgi:hypothetical protein
VNNQELRRFIMACVRDGRAEAIQLAQLGYFRLVARTCSN